MGWCAEELEVEDLRSEEQMGEDWNLTLIHLGNAGCSMSMAKIRHVYFCQYQVERVDCND
jgi:hypothetical protein